MSLFAELKRQNVFRVGIAYVLMGWVLLQGADFALDLVDAPNWVIQVFFIAIIIGLPIALFFAWAFEMTPEGIKREHEVDRSKSITPKTGRKIDRTTWWPGADLPVSDPKRSEGWNQPSPKR